MAVLSSQSFSDQTKISGQTVLTMGRQVLASCKKVMSLLERGKECFRNGCPSGKNYEDYLEYCLLNNSA